MSQRHDTNPNNALLLALDDADLRSLHLQPINLPQHKQLERRGARIESVYFLDKGIASTGAGPDARGHPVEIAMVGSEGVVGVGGIIGSRKSPYDTVMLIDGSGWRAPLEAAASLFRRSEAVRSCILAYVQVLLSQLSASAAASARNTSEERLARWLLMAQDRAGADEVTVTHDVVARMLSVRRAGISIALKSLERQGLITRRRGAIQIISRQGLVAQSNGCYASEMDAPVNTPPDREHPP
jgi:CRP-like cAMP-binding protein